MASRAQPPLWRETVKAGAARSGALIGAIAIVIASLLLLVALATYHSGDPSLNTAAGGPAENWLGTPGAWVADIAYSLLGFAMWCCSLPVAFVIERCTPVARRGLIGRWRLILAAARCTGGDPDRRPPWR